MKIVNNGYSIEIKKINGIQCLSLVDLAKLDGHNYTEFCRKVRTEPSLKPFIIRERDNLVRKTHLRIEGCVKLVSMFKFPNDELVRKLLPLITVKKPTAEEIVDAEMWRLDNEKPDFVDLKQRVETLGNKVNEIEVGNSLFSSHVQDFIDSVYDRLADVENNLSNLNDKPNQSSFKDLLKECIKEIIKEELTNERA